MGLPKQLRAQIKQGQEIEDHIRTEQKEARGDAPKDVAQQEIDALLNEVDPKETKPEEQPTAKVTELHPKPEGGDLESPPEGKPERTDWKQKYSVLKGKYDAEVPRLSQEVRDANSRINNLEDKLTTLATKSVVEEPAAAPPRTDFSPEEIADYGEDLLDVVGRKARQVVEAEYRPMINGLETQLVTLQQQVGQTGQRVGKFETNEVFAQLDSTVKDWRAINVDPAFHDWLDQVDPFTGETRKALMLKAFDRKNAHQVKSFFEKYTQENAAVVSNATGLEPSGQGGTETGSTLDLKDYIAPGTPRNTGNAGAPKEKRIWARPEITKFFSDVQKGAYKDRTDDKARIEADIVAATTEGRIKP